MLRIIITLAAVAMVALLAWAIDAQSRSPAGPATELEIPARIFASGRVEGATREVEIRPWQNGRVVQLRAVEGQSVAAGEVILKLDDQQHRAHQALAAAELARTEAELARLINGARPMERDEAAANYQSHVAQLKQARLSWNRTRALHEDRVVSDQEADEHRLLVSRLEAELAAAKARADLLTASPREEDVLMAQARVNAARAKLELARLELERRQLRAPFAGTIMKRNVELGEMTGPESLQPALVLTDTTRLRIRAFVEELEAPRVQPGMPVAVTADGLPDRTFAGRVTRVSPRMGAKQLWSNNAGERMDTKTREVWIDLESAQGLVVGLRVDVMIDAGEAPVDVPSDAADVPPSEQIQPPATEHSPTRSAKPL